MRKKIAVLSATFPPYKGGMGNVAYHFSKSLYEMGRTLTVFTPQQWKVREELNTPFRIKYLRPLFTYGNASFVPQLFFYLFRYDIIHLHFPFFGGAEVALLKKILFPKTKLILHYHFDIVGDGFIKVIFTIYRKLFYSMFFKFSDTIIFTTEDYMKHSYIRDKAEKYKKKVAFVPNGVQFNHFAFPRNISFLKQQIGIEEGSFVALFVGGLDQAHYFKGLDVLFEALSIIKRNFSRPFHMIIVGSGELLPHYHDISRSNELDSIVHFVGNVTDEILPHYYQLADITILPSVDSSEAFGLVLIESMSAGTPVIATRLPGVQEVVGEKTGFLISPNREQELARALFYVYEHAREIRSMHDDVQQHAKQFDWKVVTTKLNTLL